MTPFSIPRGDYRAYTFNLEVGGIAQDMAGMHFVFTLKRDIHDPDSEILFTEEVTISAGTAVYSAVLEITSTDTDLEPGNYWLEGCNLSDPTKPITANPVVFTITERLRKAMPVVTP